MSEGSTATAQTAGERIRRRVADLREALEIGGDRVSPEVAAAADADLDDIEARLAIGVDHTVVALVGGTGSGKSSLFNAIAGLEYAEVGVRRPTTAQVAACTWGGSAGPLLDLLGVHHGRRIQRESALDGHAQDELAGLVLLDLPDHDSIAAEHARLVDRLVPLVDLLVWVVDPQKYADNALHERYLRALVERQDGMLVLVNQIDTVPASATPRILRDVTRLLESDGLHEVAVLPTSVATGAGIDEVRDLLAGVVEGESLAAWVAGIETAAVAERLDADLAPRPSGTPGTGTRTGTGARQPAARPGPVAAGSVPPDVDTPTDRAVDHLSQACGIDAAQDAIRTAVSSSSRRQALVRPGEPTTATAAGVRDSWVESTGAGLPARWAADLDRRVPPATTLRDAVRDALQSVELPGTDVGRGWRGGALVATLLAVGALVVGVLAGGSLPAFGAAAAAAVIALACAGGVRAARRRESERRASVFADQARGAVRRAVEQCLAVPAGEVVREWDAARAAVGRAGRPGGAPPQNAP